ncbi:hypothetical protein ACFLRW_05225, partial [Acidobacteriota bacterium]
CDLNKPNWGLPEEKYAVTKVQHLGVGKPVKLLNDATPKYSLNGAEVLVDGFLASTKFNDGYWVGLHGEDLDVVVDLGKTYSLRKISVNFLENQESWIFLPDSVEFLLSEDGNAFSTIKKFPLALEKKNHKSIHVFSEIFNGPGTRYVRILAQNIGHCPQWHPGAGEKAWVFTDEVLID